MTRSQAIARIKRGLGFRSGLDDTIVVAALQEAQRELEAGKTLPKFLIVEDATFTLASGAHSVVLPEDFLRLDDENLPHFTSDVSETPIYLEQKFYSQAVVAQLRSPATDNVRAPSVFVVRSAVLDFVATADQDYEFTWNYYRHDDTLDSDVENLWLAGAPEWLIGEAGIRLAADLRDVDAVALFTSIGNKARQAVLSKTLLNETAGGPVRMGENL